MLLLKRVQEQTYKLYTLVGPTVTRPVQDPLAVKHLDNQLYILAIKTKNLKPFLKFSYKLKNYSFTLLAKFLVYFTTNCGLIVFFLSTTSCRSIILILSFTVHVLL